MRISGKKLAEFGRAVAFAVLDGHPDRRRQRFHQKMHELPKILNGSLLRILEHSSDGIGLAVADPWRVVFVNRTLARWLGKPVDVVIGQALVEVLGETWGSEAIEVQLERIRIGNDCDGSMEEILADLAVDNNPVTARCCRVVVDGEALVGFVMRPVPSDAASSDRRLDPLTHLPDRTYLLSRMANLLQGDRAADRRFSVLFLDLDNFKHVNDRYGHLLGDRVLREVASRLAACVRERDHVTRFGGDEFVLLLEGVSGLEEIAPVIKRIRAALAEPIELPDGKFLLSLSIGRAEAAPHHSSPEDVLRDADRDMYAAKRAGV
jgi:diguanylate cyclase (GGDEF)-like protein